MSIRQFLIELGIVCVGTAILLSTFHFFSPQLAQYESFSWICLTLFMCYSLGLFTLANIVVKSENKGLFTGVMMLSSLTKLLLSIIVILIYTKGNQPESSWFLIPFFTNYLIFTVLEVYFMSKVGHTKSPKKN